MFAVATLVAIGSMYVAPASAQVAAQKGKITVALESVMSIDSVAKTLLGGSFDQVSVQDSFTINGQTIQDFVTITPNQTAGEVSSNWSNGRKTLISQLTKNGFFAKNSKFASANTTDDSTTFAVKNITVYGDRQSAINTAGKFTGIHSTFQSSGNVGAASRKPTKAQPVSPTDGQITTFAVANTPYYTLLPISGSVITGLFTAPGVSGTWRGVQNYMGWNSNGFASDQTYEHDFFLDASGGTYFARSFSLPPSCQPNAVYAATSWPSTSYPYLDSDLESSGLCSSSGNIAYTIGAAQANAITTGMTHFTAILMPDGDASTDIFLLQGQVGYQFPVGCHGPLCSYPYGYGVRETTHYGLTSGTVPNTISWTVPAVFALDRPENVSVSNPTSSSLRLNFIDVSWDETNISAERSVGPSGPWTIFNFGILNGGTAVGSWYWDNTGLSSHIQYCYRMRATNAVTSSAYSPTVCGNTL